MLLTLRNLILTRVITFIRKTIHIAYNYNICGKCVASSEPIKDLRVRSGSIFFFAPSCRLHIFSVTQNVGTHTYVDLFLFYYR